MGLSVPAATNPSVLIAELKAELSIPSANTDHDNEITRLEARATSILETMCHRNFTTRTLVLTLDAFPASKVIQLPRPPLVSVTSIQYLDTDGNSQTWASSNYIVGTASTPGKITPAVNVSWPTTQNRIEAVTVTYIAGFGADETSVPQIAKQAVQLTVKHWFEKTTQEGTIPAGAKQIISALHPGVLGECYGVAS